MKMLSSFDHLPKNPSAVGIQCSASLSSLGSSSAQLQHALTHHTDTLSLRDDLLVDGHVYVGAYAGEIEDCILPTALQPLDSRNLRLALTALRQIQVEVQRLTHDIPLHRLAVVIGTSTSGIADNEPILQQHFQHLNVEMSYQKQQMNAISLGLKQFLGWQGVAYTISTACSSSAKAFATGQRLLNAHLADAVLVGGVDSLCQLTLNGFNSLESLSQGICQPCGVARDGINIGESASLFLLTRAAAPVMLVGVGESMDAWHISAPHPEGRGAYQAMQRALQQANLNSQHIDYVNLHGTATPQNDAMEIKAIRQLFAGHAPLISSTKHKTGHCLGAAGALEAFICQQVLCDQSWLPLHHAGVIDAELADQHYVQQAEISQPIHYVMSNSFAFGGSNMSLIFGTSF
ncbi:MAG: beta-ketoacyl-ACP synthase [Acinetobacter sp.]